MRSEPAERRPYIATAQALDEEMVYRIKLHRERRPAGWLTFEAYEDAPGVLVEALNKADMVIFDCLTIYVSNLLLAPSVPAGRQDRYRRVLEETQKLLAAAKQGTGTVVFVTNEVGAGIVPDNALAREFRDLAGLVNQKVALAADEVYLLISGLAVEIKKQAVFPPES